MAKILAEKSHGSKFDPQILTIWTSTLHCSGDCDFMVTIVTMHLSGMLFRQNSVKSLIRCEDICHEWAYSRVVVKVK